MGIAVLGEPFGLSVFELSVFGLWPALLLHFLSPSLPRPPFLGIRWSCAVRLVGDETSMLEGDHVSRVRLLDQGRPEARETPNDAHFDTNSDTLSAHRPTATFSFEAGDLLPQRRERRE